MGKNSLGLQEEPYQERELAWRRQEVGRGQRRPCQWVSQGTHDDCVHVLLVLRTQLLNLTRKKNQKNIMLM